MGRRGWNFNPEIPVHQVKEQNQRFPMPYCVLMQLNAIKVIFKCSDGRSCGLNDEFGRVSGLRPFRD